MHSETILLKLFSSREVFDNYFEVCNLNGLEVYTQEVLKSYRAWFESNVGDIDLKTYPLYFFQSFKQDIPEYDARIYRELFKQLDTVELDNYEGTIKELLQSYEKAKILNDIKSKATISEGTVTELQNLLDKYSDLVVTEEEVDYLPNSWEAVKTATAREHGLQWRLKGLKRSVGKIIKGDFGVVAAYVETGKSAFLCSEVSYMASQLTDGCILWFNCEGTTEQIQKRFTSALLGMTAKELDVLSPETIDNMKSNAMHHDLDRVRFFDSHNLTFGRICGKIRKHKPKLVIIDPADFLLTGGKEDSLAESTRLGILYANLRKLSARHCPILVTSQCNADSTYKDGQGDTHTKRKVDMAAMRQSQVDKQGTADFLIMIGKEDGNNHQRFINLVKNKLDGDGTLGARHAFYTVGFDENRSLYLDVGSE